MLHCLLALLALAAPQPVPDSLVVPLRTDTVGETELIMFPPRNVRLPVWYQIDWGDGTVTDWEGPLRSMVDISRYHHYSHTDTFSVRVRSRDSLGNTSEWSRPVRTSVEPPLLEWVFPTAEPVVASPALDAQGNVYIGDESGLVYCIGPDGQFRWMFETRGPVYGSVAIDDTLVYVVSLDSSLYCLSLAGTKLWSLDVEDEIYSAPAIGPDHVVYVATDAGTVCAVAPGGRLRWTYKTGEEMSSSPTVGPDGRVYVTGDSVYCLEPKGRRRWAFGAPGDNYFYAGAVIAPDGLVYVGAYDGYVYCIGPNGRLRWRAPSLDECEIRSEVVFGLDSTLWFGSDADYAFRMKPGGVPEPLLEAVDIVISTPAVSDRGSAFFLPDDGTLYGITADGRLLMKEEVVSGDKELYYTSSPALGPDGRLYVGSWDGGLYCYRVDGPPARTLWPQYRGDAQHTGRVRRP